MSSPEFIIPEWKLPNHFNACVTTRIGGFSTAAFASMNLGNHVGDDTAIVQQNRQQLRQSLNLSSEPVWLNQNHSNTVIDAAKAINEKAADAAWTNQADIVCCIMTADCLPVLFANPQRGLVAAAHAGWRGLAGGILEATIDALQCPACELSVWLGPAIGPEAFEVGDEVRTAFVSQAAIARSAFKLNANNRWMGDLYLLARQKIEARGVKPEQISGGMHCTYHQKDQFFSYRRDGITGRMASLIWMDSRPS